MTEVIVLGAEWCGPCKMMKSQTVAPLKDEGFEIEVVDIESDRGVELSQQHRVRGVPATIITKDEVTTVIVGAKTKSELKALIS